MNKHDSSKHVIKQLERFEQQLPPSIQQQLNQRRQQVVERRHQRNNHFSFGLAACLALGLVIFQFYGAVSKPTKVDVEVVAEVQPEMFKEDIQMLAQLEFAYWLSEQETDEAG